MGASDCPPRGGTARSRPVDAVTPQFGELEAAAAEEGADTAAEAGTGDAAAPAGDAAAPEADALPYTLDGERAAYGLCRPPGHHATTSLYGGYCFFNNAAIGMQVNASTAQTFFDNRPSMCSGATYSWWGYANSLQQAIDKATY